jgi:hypothetical protein
MRFDNDDVWGTALNRSALDTVRAHTDRVNPRPLYPRHNWRQGLLEDAEPTGNRI